MDKRTVLFVDDEEKVLKALQRGLANQPCNTLFAAGGKEALEIIEHNRVQVLVTDMRMPEMSGLDLLGIVKNKYPYIIRLILSGYADTETLLGAINEGEIYRFIPKPWNHDEELKTVIRQSIEFYDLHSEREMLTRFFEMWVEGLEPESTDVRFLKGLISTRKKHLYEWRKTCDSIPLNSQ